jgi:hypothetical protein
MVHFPAVFAVKSVLTLYAFYRKNGLINSSRSSFLNLIDGGLRSYERCVKQKTRNMIIHKF